MKSKNVDPPRKFKVGLSEEIEISHCANITLEPNEQVTFVTNSGTEYDVARKEWGYYATPSTNERLSNHNLRTALVINNACKLYVMLCENGKEEEFERYLRKENQKLLIWLDKDSQVRALMDFIDQ